MALQRGGDAVDDPVAWFNSLPEDVASLWDSFYRVEPFGGEWQRHASQMELLEHLFASVVNRGLTQATKHLAYKPRDRRSFFPGCYAGEDEPQQAKQKQRRSIADQLDDYAKTIGAKR